MLSSSSIVLVIIAVVANTVPSAGDEVEQDEGVEGDAFNL